MIKKILIAFLSLLSILGLALSVNYVKADGGVVETVDGASIRLTDPQGLRFTGQVTGTFSGTLIEYGFLLSKGDYTKEQMVQLLDQDKAAFYPVGTELDESKKFYLSIVNIPSSAFEQDITALACVRIDGNITYSTASTARNIKEVATAAAADPEYVSNAFIDDIAAANISTFNLNGGEFICGYTTVVGAYNGGGDGKSGLTFSANKSHSGVWWNRVYLKTTELDSNLYEVVHYEPGDGHNSNNQVASLVHYDYILAGHSATAGALEKAQAIGTYKYVYISALATGATIKADNNCDLLLNKNYVLADGDTLPTAQKAYYTFNGWRDNAGLTGDAIIIKDGNAAETFYAKFTPNQYTLTYNLQDGTSTASTDPVNFTIESGAITLPIASTMSREDYEFTGWNTSSDGTGSYLTEIAAGSHEDITVYAMWSASVPVNVDLSVAQLTALAAANPTKVVKPEFTAGKFTIAGNTYKVGEGQLYATVAGALAEANDNDVIFVFAGTYSAALSITKSVKIIGEEGATVSGAVTIDAAVNGLTLEGFSITSSLVFNAVNENVLLKKLTVNTGSEIAFNGAATTTGFTARDCSFNVRTARGIRWYCNATDVSFINCAFTSSNNGMYDYIRIETNYGFGGKFVLKGCSFGATNQSHLMFMNTRACTYNIIDNTFTGAANTIIDIRNPLSPTAETVVAYNIIGNTFRDSTCGWAAIRVRNTGLADAAHFPVNINYNKFININTEGDSDYLVERAAGSLDDYINADYNYYCYNDTVRTTPLANWFETHETSAIGWFASEAALEEAYELAQRVDITFFTDGVVGQAYNNAMWTREKYQNSGWQVISGQMNCRDKDGVKVVNMVGGYSTAALFTYNKGGDVLGKANKLTLKLGNYFGGAQAMGVKIILIDEENVSHYLMGDSSNFANFDVTTGLTKMTFNFAEMNVKSLAICVYSTMNGSAYLYVGDARLNYQVGDTEAPEITISSAVQSALAAKTFMEGDDESALFTQFMAGISIEDDVDGTIAVTNQMIDMGGLNPANLVCGRYTITITAEDEAGNVAVKEVEIVVTKYANLTLDFMDGTVGQQYNSSAWKQEKYTTGWVAATGQMNCREKNGVRVVNFASGFDTAHRFTYNSNGAPIGFTNKITLKVGNYWSPNQPIPIKIILVDTKGVQTYLVGSSSEFSSFPTTDGLVDQVFDSFGTIDVQSIVVVCRYGSNATAYLYVGDVHFIYE